MSGLGGDTQALHCHEQASIVMTCGMQSVWVPKLQHTGSRGRGLCIWGVWGQQLQRVGLPALWHMGSSFLNLFDPCTGRQLLNHWTTKEGLSFHLLSEGWVEEESPGCLSCSCLELDFCNMELDWGWWIGWAMVMSCPSQGETKPQIRSCEERQLLFLTTHDWNTPARLLGRSREAMVHMKQSHWDLVAFLK